MSLRIEPKRRNELNNKAELEVLAEIIKQVNYPDSKPVYRYRQLWQENNEYNN